MNVRVEVNLRSSPSRKDKDEMYATAMMITDDADSIVVSQDKENPKTIIAEFTIKKARQMDVVDKIAKAFRTRLKNYNDSSISFP
jgi:hypothetical protein